MWSEAEWARVAAYTRSHALPEAEIAIMRAGCPQHGNVPMDFDEVGAYCTRCDRVRAASALEGI